jgi:hypothetical protein
VNGGATYLEVEAKVDELNKMKSRLANLQSLVAAINSGEMPFVIFLILKLEFSLKMMCCRNPLSLLWLGLILRAGETFQDHLLQNQTICCVTLTPCLKHWMSKLLKFASKHSNYFLLMEI